MRTWLALTLVLGCGGAQIAPGGVQQIGVAIEEPDLDEPELLAIDFPHHRATWIAAERGGTRWHRAEWTTSDEELAPFVVDAQSFFRLRDRYVTLMRAPGSAWRMTFMLQRGEDRRRVACEGTYPSPIDGLERATRDFMARHEHEIDDAPIASEEERRALRDRILGSR